ncbi:GTPase Der [Candidatus Xenohaliotis californiensis]|uniref:GTPase Der n=1 Tax=Candidatus Xenohaliotis californiensis TaxID=84677 RepID=A0ABM9N9B3_9RICK|nr:GTPase Der [Candidatus Xenohaliotis californiensis]
MPNNTIAIVGRPNVGKSTLFNRLAIDTKSIVSNIPGVTRDYNIGHCTYNDSLYWCIIDTAGLDNTNKDKILNASNEKTIQAIKSTTAVLMVIDGKDGITSEDEYWSKWLRKNCVLQKIILVVNKCDHKKTLENADLVHTLGFKDCVFISAEHNIGIAELLEKIKEYAINIDTLDTDRHKNFIRLAIIGRPNAGKSTLINSIIGVNRMLTGSTPGLTRDSIEIEHTYNNRKIILFDTSGLRKKSKINEILDKLSAVNAINTINYAHVVIILIDATLGFEKQDLALIGLTIREGRGVVIAINKWDMVTHKQAYIKQAEHLCTKHIGGIKNIPIVTISAINNQIKNLLDKAITVFDSWNNRIITSKLNQWLAKTVQNHPPKISMRRVVNIKFITQITTRPPTFFISTNMPDNIDNSYKNYLINSLHKNFQFIGTPLRIKFK